MVRGIIFQLQNLYAQIVDFFIQIFLRQFIHILGYLTSSIPHHNVTPLVLESSATFLQFCKIFFYLNVPFHQNTLYGFLCNSLYNFWHLILIKQFLILLVNDFGTLV